MWISSMCIYLFQKVTPGKNVQRLYNTLKPELTTNAQLRVVEMITLTFTRVLKGALLSSCSRFPMRGRPEGPGGKRNCLRLFRFKSHSKTMSSPAEISVKNNSIVPPNEWSLLSGKTAETSPDCSPQAVPVLLGGQQAFCLISVSKLHRYSHYIRLLTFNQGASPPIVPLRPDAGRKWNKTHTVCVRTVCVSRRDVAALIY